MASKLLNVLNSIDTDRKNSIAIMQSKGIVISQDARFTDMVVYINQIEPPESAVLEPLFPAWERPEEWPDCKSILENATTIHSDRLNKDLVPVAIYLFKELDSSLDATITLPKYTASVNQDNVGTEMKISARAYLLSDDTWVDSASDTLHTWDRSKDIIIDSGEYAGRYRWAIDYRQTIQEGSRFIAFPISTPLYTTWPLIEVISKYPVPHTGKQRECYSLMNIELLPNQINKTISTSSFNNPIFSYFYNLRNLDLGDITSLKLRYGFKNLIALHKLDLSNLELEYDGNNEVQICVGLSLEQFKGPRSVKLGTTSSGEKKITLGSTPALTSLVIPSDTFLGLGVIEGIEGTVNPIPLLNDYILSTNKCIYYGNAKWTIGILPLLRVPNITDTLLSCTPFRTLVVLNNVADTSSYNVHRNSTISAGNQISYCNSIILPENSNARLDLRGWLYLKRDALLNVFNSLEDLTDTVTYNPTIKLSAFIHKPLLNAEDIAIATNKGWTVTFE